MLLVIQPSFAFMESVFSVLRSCMKERQGQISSDRTRLAAMLKYNRTFELTPPTVVINFQVYIEFNVKRSD